MKRFFGKRKENKQLETQNKEVKPCKDIPVSHLMVPFTVVTSKGPVSLGHPHVMTEFFLKNKATKSKDNESRE